jgi:hypothetical protein
MKAVQKPENRFLLSPRSLRNVFCSLSLARSLSRARSRSRSLALALALALALSVSLSLTHPAIHPPHPSHHPPVAARSPARGLTLSLIPPPPLTHQVASHQTLKHPSPSPLGPPPPAAATHTHTHGAHLEDSPSPVSALLEATPPASATAAGGTNPCSISARIDTESIVTPPGRIMGSGSAVESSKACRPAHLRG